MSSRFRLPSLFALAALLCVGLLAGCGGDDDKGGAAGGGKTDDPRALLKKAFASQVESGELKMKAGMELEGSRRVGGPVSFTLEGPFKSRGKTKMPLVDWDISATGMGQDLSGGIVATEDNAFLRFRGQTYEVGSRLYEQFVRMQERRSKAGPKTLQDVGIDPSAWLDDPEVSDGGAVGGSATRKVSGDLDVERMVDDFLDAAKSPELRKQLRSRGRMVPEVSEADKRKVVDAVKDAEVAVYVDDQDIARKVVLSADFDVPEGVDSDGVTGGKAEFSYELSKVGGDVQITAPSDAKPLSLLLQQFGLGAGLPGGGFRTQ